MRIMSLGAAAIIAATTFGAAQAQKVNPENCVANVAALDVNGDGYVDSQEMAQYGRIETNVDTDGDGRISNQETTVACRDGAMAALKPKN
jgi:hypothetical protein